MYYITYESYTEYNQFEGEWNPVVDKYPTLEAATAARKWLAKDRSKHKVSPVLTNAVDPKKLPDNSIVRYIVRLVSELKSTTKYLCETHTQDDYTKAVLFEDEKVAKKKAEDVAFYGRLWDPDLVGDVVKVVITYDIEL